MEKKLGVQKVYNLIKQYLDTCKLLQYKIQFKSL